MKEEPLLLLSDLQKLINQVVLIDYTIIILGGEIMYLVNRVLPTVGMRIPAHLYRERLVALGYTPIQALSSLRGCIARGTLIVGTNGIFK